MDKEMQWWWPLALDEALGSEPLAVRLLGQHLVLWRDAKGQAVLMVDRCPHRGARLSQGRIRDHAIECPYHGWRFDQQGSCKIIPATPDFQPPASFKICRYPVVEMHGLIWGGARRGHLRAANAAQPSSTKAALWSVRCGYQRTTGS